MNVRRLPGLVPACFLLLALFSTARALADEVTIEWQTDPGLFQYELEIQQGRKVVFDQRFPASVSSWKGSLPFGVYTYRLRTVDAQQRAGEWGEATSFLVTPAAPRPLLPPNHSTLYFRPGPGITLKWSEVRGVQSFAVELIPDTGAATQQITEGNQMTLPMLPLGGYSWRVKPILRASNASKKKFQAQILDNKASETWHFRVERVKDATYWVDVQKITLLHQTAGPIPFEVGDYLCLFPKEAEHDPVACGTLVEKKEPALSLTVIVQSHRLFDGEQYELSDPKRKPASLPDESSFYQFTDERGSFKTDLTVGLMAGTTYVWPALQAQQSIHPGLALGLRYAYANEENDTSSLRLNAFLLTVTRYLGRFNYSGFFGEAGAGANYFRAKASGVSTGKLVPSALLCGGWQFRPTSQGFNLGLSAGVQYFPKPVFSSLSVHTGGFLPLLTFLMGYSF